MFPSPLSSSAPFPFRPAFSFFFMLLLFAILISTPNLAQARCKKPPIIFNFGDSNSDTGGSASGLGFPFKLPFGRSFFGRPAGRFCDGRLVIDFLCQSLNTRLLRPYLDPFGSTFANGANFAISGSQTLPRFTPFVLDVQLMQFQYFKNHSTELAAAGVSSLISYDRFKDALYMIDIGQNDIADSFVKGFSYAQLAQKIPSVLAEIQGAIQQIYDQGGRKFWVHNTGPLGCLPQKLALANDTLSLDRDSFGCIRKYNDAAKLFNEGLRRKCVRLRSQMKDATIVYVDMYAIKMDIIANSSTYGFSNPLMACCGAGGPPYNYIRGLTCGVPGYNACDQNSRFVSWDGVHYTEAANKLIASKILSSAYSTPRVPFDFFCQ
ncbi:GDSL esterase/lipase At1g09390-like [Andrographis paniculata]|uniref:GDSL esterase/lipase At1g09390-like n=1 Tax=Andrographis paniculata TaxID=175694 RepID=UPI0021E7024F|nr:GDSL esterase/lipase At1g09390-like [Andrographis paniculata]